MRKPRNQAEKIELLTRVACELASKAVGDLTAETSVWVEQHRAPEPSEPEVTEDMLKKAVKRGYAAVMALSDFKVARKRIDPVAEVISKLKNSRAIARTERDEARDEVAKLKRAKREAGKRRRDNPGDDYPVPKTVRLKRFIAELTRLLDENGNLVVYRSGVHGYGCPAPLPTIRFVAGGEVYHRTPPDGRKSRKIVIVDRSD